MEIKMQSVLKIVNCERYNLLGGYMVVVFNKLYFLEAFLQKKKNAKIVQRVSLYSTSGFSYY